MDKKKTSRKISDKRKTRIIAALKEQELSPEEVAKKARLPFETVVSIAKEHLKISDPDISDREVFELLGNGSKEQVKPDKEPAQTQRDAQAQSSFNKQPSSSCVSPATKGRIVAALKSGKRTPESIADQAGISIETLAEWARECMGLDDDGQTPADIFRMFQNSNPFLVTGGLYRTGRAYAKSRPGNQKRAGSQLCWDCINAVPSEKHGCPWSESFTPVEGWEAEKTEESYNVINCPLFERG